MLQIVSTMLIYDNVAGRGSVGGKGGKMEHHDNWGWRARIGIFIVGNEAVPEAVAEAQSSESEENSEVETTGEQHDNN